MNRDAAEVADQMATRDANRKPLITAKVPSLSRSVGLLWIHEAGRIGRASQTQIHTGGCHVEFTLARILGNHDDSCQPQQSNPQLHADCFQRDSDLCSVCRKSCSLILPTERLEMCAMDLADRYRHRWQGIPSDLGGGWSIV